MTNFTSKFRFRKDSSKMCGIDCRRGLIFENVFLKDYQSKLTYSALNQILIKSDVDINEDIFGLAIPFLEKNWISKKAILSTAIFKLLYQVPINPVVIRGCIIEN